jgi:predicted GIY-YIG superfamily endonuclease
VTSPLEPKPTTLYRFYASDGTLLYIGVAGNPGRRFEQHRGEKPWWGDVARVRLEHLESREAALEAESKAIKAEHPRYNIQGRSSISRPPAIAYDAPSTVDQIKPYPLDTVWTFRYKRRGDLRTSTLVLLYELDGSSLSDDYLPDEYTAFQLWQEYTGHYFDAYHRKNPAHYRPGEIHIFWYVTALDERGVFEAAPCQTLPPGPAYQGMEDFLTHFSDPYIAETGERLNWLRLPVLDRRWTSEWGDKGGFIQQVTGWKPSALQPRVDLNQLMQASRLGSGGHG